MTATAKKTKKKAAAAEIAKGIIDAADIKKSTALVTANHELVTVEGLTPAEIFTDVKISEFIERVKNLKNDFLAKGVDAKTDEGFVEIKRFAASIIRTRTLVDEDIGKEFVRAIKEEPKRIDGLRKQFRDQLDAWAAEVRAPVTAIEAADKIRKDAHEKFLKDIGDTLTFPVGQPSSAEVQRRIDFVVLFQQRNWEEYDGLYQTTYKNVTEALANILVTAKAAEEAAAELVKLRKKQADDAEKERTETARLAGIEEGKKLAAAPAPQPAPVSQPMPEAPAPSPTRTVLMPMKAAPRSAADEAKAVINREVLEALVLFFDDKKRAIITPTELSRALVISIASGKIPHVTINYGGVV